MEKVSGRCFANLIQCLLRILTPAIRAIMGRVHVAYRILSDWLNLLNWLHRLNWLNWFNRLRHRFTLRSLHSLFLVDGAYRCCQVNTDRDVQKQVKIYPSCPKGLRFVIIKVC